MYRVKFLSLLLALAAALPCAVSAQQAGATKTGAKARTQPAPRAPELQPEAVAVLKAMSAKLAALQSMSFTATVTYEAPSRIGPPLAYSTVSEVAMQRPNRLRVVTSGDGAASEFYYDGKTMTAYSPAEHLVAIAPAPPTLGAMLQQAYDNAAIYFPFDDLLTADPYQNIAADLTVAFVVGRSSVVGDVPTDVIALVSDTLFVQMWIGVDDKLPRMMRAMYRGDPLRLRHQLVLTNWKLDPAIAAEAFASLDAAKATAIAFAPPQMAAVAAKPATGRKAAKAGSAQ